MQPYGGFSENVVREIQSEQGREKGARLPSDHTTAAILLCQYKNEDAAKCKRLSGLRGGPGVGLAGFDESEVGR
jgi:hypothetical protein